MLSYVFDYKRVYRESFLSYQNKLAPSKHAGNVKPSDKLLPEDKAGLLVAAVAQMHQHYTDPIRPQASPFKDMIYNIDIHLAYDKGEERPQDFPGSLVNNFTRLMLSDDRLFGLCGLFGARIPRGLQKLLAAAYIQEQVKMCPQKGPFDEYGVFLVDDFLAAVHLVCPRLARALEPSYFTDIKRMVVPVSLLQDGTEPFVVVLGSKDSGYSVKFNFGIAPIPEPQGGDLKYSSTYHNVALVTYPVGNSPVFEAYTEFEGQDYEVLKAGDRKKELFKQAAETLSTWAKSPQSPGPLNEGIFTGFLTYFSEPSIPQFIQKETASVASPVVRSRLGSGAGLQDNFRDLVQKLGVSQRQWLQWPAVTQGVQKLIAVTYILGYGTKAFDSEGYFNFADFYQKIGQHNMALRRQLKPSYFQNIQWENPKGKYQPMRVSMDTKKGGYDCILSFHAPVEEPPSSPAPASVASPGSHTSSLSRDVSSDISSIISPLLPVSRVVSGV